jgi:ADP-heptose:LPS heptosyltransferase
VLRRAELLVTNDSGPMHLAVAVGAPVVALFGPTEPRAVGPYGPGHLVLRKAIDCSSCTRQHCVRDLACLTAITVEEVCAAVESMRRPSNSADAEPRRVIPSPIAGGVS